MSSIPLLSVEQAAERLKISTRRVQKLCEDGRIGQMVGGTYVIPEDELKAFAKMPRNPGRPKNTDDR